MQNVVAMLNEADRFNSAITLTVELRKDAEGKERQVQTIYLGLGQAYFADEKGTIAGTGVPGANGWAWRPSRVDGEYSQGHRYLREPQVGRVRAGAGDHQVGGVLMRKTLILLLVVLLCQALCQAQTFKAAAGSAKADLDKALAELSALEKQIADEKIPLSREMNKLESAVIAKRREHSDAKRLQDRKARLI